MTDYVVRWLDEDGCVVEDVSSSLKAASARMSQVDDGSILARTKCSYSDGSWHWEYHEVVS